MIVKTKERKENFFKDIKVGQVFKGDYELFMKISFDDDFIVCPQCGEGIYAEKELGGIAVHLETGNIYKFNNCDSVEIVTGSFIEE